MPSTEYFGYGLTNNGPLTTTFTAARSCASNPANTVVLDEAFDIPQVLRTTCGAASFDEACLPSAGAFNSAASRAWEGEEGHMALGYHSPGFICPSGWTTAGVASLEGDGVSATGDFSKDFRSFGDSVVAAGLVPAQLFLNALGDEETLVWCCPRYVAYSPSTRARITEAELTDDFGTAATKLISTRSVFLRSGLWRKTPMGIPTAKCNSLRITSRQSPVSTVPSGIPR